MDARDLPPGPERSWLPAFTQSRSVEFWEQREQELSRYLQRLVASVLKLKVSGFPVKGSGV